MTTRRTTRRTGIVPDAENSLAATTVSTTITNAVGGASKGLKGKGLSIATKASTSTSSAIPRKRVLGDVTNAAKSKPTSTIIAGASRGGATFVKPTLAAAAPIVVRRTIRTRSSTGGSAAKLDEESEDERRREEGMSSVKADEGDDDNDEEEVDENAMVIDEPVQRVIKPIRQSARASTSSNTAAMTKPTTIAATTKAVATVAATRPRLPLASKTTNRTITSTTTSRAAATKKKATTVTSKGITAVRARIAAAEAASLLAKAELEAAMKEEEEHAAKRARTTSDLELDQSDDIEEDEEEEDEEAVEEAESKARRKSAHINGLGMKDEGWIDLDDGDEDDPLMVSTYVVEVYEYMRELELTTMPDVEYMDRQNEVTWKMRGILVDWLVEIHTKFRLLPETIFLATNIIDRFLSTRVVSLVKFQLVGVTALFIASKYEEVVCPSVSNFLYMTDGGYEDDEILKAERYVLAMIDFNLSYPNPINFLRRISKADGYDITSRTLAKYLMEISIVDHKFLRCPPSLIAAAGSWLARKALNKGAWDPNLVHYSGYTEKELLPTAQLMLDYVVRSSTLRTDGEDVDDDNPLRTVAVRDVNEHPNFAKKYAGKKFFKASTLMRSWAQEEFAPTRVNLPNGKIGFAPTPPILRSSS